MALFRRNKNDEPDESKPFQPQPEKAQKWFDAARTQADSYQYEGALNYYANGLKFEPDRISAVEGMYESAIQYANRGGKPAAGKERKAIDDGTPIGRYASATFAWMKEITSADRALEALDAAVKAEQKEVGHWMAERMINLVRNSKKVSKSMLVRAKNLFAAVDAWDQAIIAGELAAQLDPSDSDLAAEIKDLSAQRAMDQGGYEKAAGQEGGFRTMVRDADKQRAMEEAESLSGGQSLEERNLARAKEAYEAAPTLADNINRYAQLLKKRQDLESDELAHRIYLEGFSATGEYRFRMAAGDIRIDQFRRREKALTEKLAKEGESEALQAELKGVRQERLELQVAEYGERMQKYPTDRRMKYDFGRVAFELGQLDDAMAGFQAAKEEPKLRVRAGHMLGRCFAAETWHREAVAEYKEALAAIDATERDRELDIRYDLMTSLLEQARQDRDPELGREALDICSGIARRNITFRDIRAKRKEIDELLREFDGPSK